MKQKPIQILSEIEGNKVFPVYLLCGKETFLIEGTLKQMLDKLLTPDTRDFNLTYFDGNTASVRDILSSVEVYPVMSEWRVTVVDDFPAFKSRKRTTSPLTTLRNAMQSESEDAQKCVTDIAKLLGVPIEQIANGHPDFNNAIEEMGETLGDGLTEDVRAFLTRLPQLAASLPELDNQSESRSSDSDTELLLEWLQEDLPKTSVLVFTIKDEVSERNRFAKAIQDVGRYVAFNPQERRGSLNQDPLYKKVVDKFATYNKKITPRAFEQLRQRTGGDMQTIAEAINKITNFVGDKHQIDEADVRNLVAQSTYDRIFDLTDAIGKRSPRQALKSLREIVLSGQDPFLITAAIVSHLRLTLQAKLIAEKKELKPIGRQTRYDNFIKNIFQPLAEEFSEILPKSASHNIMKRNPYVAFKIFQSLHAFTTAELMRALEQTLAVEVQMKTTSVDGELLLEQLLYDICSAKSR
ncbi:DNA polymerase III subunit delta [Candidatus Poribacteria bacterium]|nr:DNA polymerase III subunit delta [Candidatus Poribacteria bacterium]MYF57318.1 DNA polymerase III subunit delta [Candidatus Poribacteria bacterium]MYI94969.1 DNA polymerase III subunit delta [Candidatus Poribacteria bacterium]